MGRAGLEPATLGLKVLHIDRKPNLKKRRFDALDKPFRVRMKSLSAHVSSANEADISRFVLRWRHSREFRSRGRGAFMVR
jgi:hypothetical protein